MELLMSSQDFAYWLQGFFELSGTTTLNEEQVKVLKEHLALVLKKQTHNTVSSTLIPSLSDLAITC